MRRRWIVLGVVVVLGAATAAYFLKPVTGPARDLTLVGDVARGDYLIRLGGCVACHTNAAAGGAELAGGVGLETAFGTFVPPNITSDPDVGIGRWTVQQFSDAMSNGMGPQGHLYPTFPYENYTLMSDQEIVDLYAALMATEPVSTPAGESQVPFPFNIRLAMAGWQNLFFRPARFSPEEGQSEQYNRGKYLAYGPAHCVACHTPRNALGALEWDKALTGSPGGTGGRAPALTAAALTEEGYDVPTLVQTLKDGFTPGFDVLGGSMGEVIADSTSHWTDEDLTALATYLLTE
ncbi:Cytochrome c, mono- and diheme variants [Devosia lucknowensis]|uniref:Cytochrome c, mono- and diheme variants n=1 Tax=Devosia lucknowensis TaxID=1096929 RepID=A0A1Y6FNS1_9HYPH|nr:cytochrome c [Devosia lucknowensis]SMQ75936.1 Cytochrome c, mono- and diheme variants [Devosia lucknowensis]